RLHVVKRHRIPAAVVIDLVGNGKAEGIRFACIRRDDEGIQVAQAARGILPRGVGDVAIGLLPHLEQTVRGVPCVGIVGKVRALQRKWSVPECIEILYSRIEIWELSSLWGPRRTGGQ